MGKAFLLIGFFVTAPFLLIFCILFLSISPNQKGAASVAFYSPSQSVAYAALPNTQNVVEDSVEGKDARVETVKQFFAKYDSPLEPYAQSVVEAADRYELDFRLIPAIAMQESNLCKKAPEGSHNCWGFGIYGNKIKTFESYPEAIDTITKTLAQEYKTKHGLDTPDEIMTRYTPSSNGSWAFGVNHFMDLMR